MKVSDKLVQSMILSGNDGLNFVMRYLMDDAYTALNRCGLTRKCLIRQNLTPGEIPTARVSIDKTPTDVAISTEEISIVPPQKPVSSFYPPEYASSTKIVFTPSSEADLGKVSSVEVFYSDLARAMLVEDQTFIRLLNKNPVIVPGTKSFSDTLEIMKQRSGFKRGTILLGSSAMGFAFGDPEVMNLLEPVAERERIYEGHIGSIGEFSLLTDAYRHPEHRVLETNAMYMIPDKLETGQFSDREGYSATPVSTLIDPTISTTDRGIMIHAIMSMLLYGRAFKTTFAS